MKFIPLLFSTQMVQATEKLFKEKTRRTKGLEEINKKPNEWKFKGMYHRDLSKKKKHVYCALFEDANGFINNILCPYGEPNDVLWVRETYSLNPFYDSVDNDEKYLYKSRDIPFEDHKWKPGIHMPKSACRIFLQVKSINIERLQSISEEDILKEGVRIPSYKNSVLFKATNENSAWSFMPEQWQIDQLIENKGKEKYTPSAYDYLFAHWAELWCEINGVENWNLNPWVWVIEFEKISKPENFLPIEFKNV